MLDTTPTPRVATDSRSRARTSRFSRLTRPSAARRSTSLTETLSVGLGLTQR